MNLAGRRRLRIAIAGASGLIGSELSRELAAVGHSVTIITRSHALVASNPWSHRREERIVWDPSAGFLPAELMEGFDAVINLAGAPVAQRWTRSHKKEIRESRVAGTALIARTITGLKQKPSVLLNASAVGYYGNRGNEILSEASGAGNDWLAQLASEWEQSTSEVEEAGVRVVRLRTGIVLSASGGMLGKVLPIFRLGAGGVLGSGDQWLSPISMVDEVAAIRHCLVTEAIAGPVNLTGPMPVTNLEFTRTLASILHRPAIIRVPAWSLRLLFGEMAGGTVLSSQRVLPGVLEETGFVFRNRSLESMLRSELARLG